MKETALLPSARPLPRQLTFWKSAWSSWASFFFNKMKAMFFSSLLQMIKGSNEHVECGRLCKLWAAVNERWSSRGEGTSVTGGTGWGFMQAILRPTKRVPVLVYIIISRSTNLLHSCPRESTSICTFVFQLVFLASEEALKDFFPPQSIKEG